MSAVYVLVRTDYEGVAMIMGSDDPEIVKAKCLSYKAAASRAGVMAQAMEESGYVDAAVYEKAQDGYYLSLQSLEKETGTRDLCDDPDRYCVQSSIDGKDFVCVCPALGVAPNNSVFY